MKSPIFALLLIVNLLTCPLRCMACESHAAAGVEDKCATCDCCSDSEEPAAPQDTEPHDQDCGCKSCVCEGAVVASAVELPLADMAFCWILPIHLELPSQECSLVLGDISAFSSFGLIYSGRGARIAHQSWQI